MTAESQDQREADVRRRLEEVRAQIEQDIASTSDSMLKRIELDAATVVTLSIVAELLPPQVREQVRELVDLHEEVWLTDTVPADGTTPRKPLRGRFFGMFSPFTRSAGAYTRLLQYYTSLLHQSGRM